MFSKYEKYLKRWNGRKIKCNEHGGSLNNWLFTRMYDVRVAKNWHNYPQYNFAPLSFSSCFETHDNDC